MTKISQNVQGLIKEGLKEFVGKSDTEQQRICINQKINTIIVKQENICDPEIFVCQCKKETTQVHVGIGQPAKCECNNISVSQEIKEKNETCGC